MKAKDLLVRYNPIAVYEELGHPAGCGNAAQLTVLCVFLQRATPGFIVQWQHMDAISTSEEQQDFQRI